MFSIAAISLLAAQATYTTKSVDCAAIAHKPAADVEYKEGENTGGYAVAPAEITPPVLSKDDFRRIPVPLNIPLENYPARKPDFAKSDAQWQRERQARKDAEGEKPGVPTYSTDTSESWIQPGLVTVDTQNGKVMLDDKELTPPEPAELNPECWE